MMSRSILTRIIPEIQTVEISFGRGLVNNAKPLPVGVPKIFEIGVLTDKLTRKKQMVLTPRRTRRNKIPQRTTRISFSQSRRGV